MCINKVWKISTKEGKHVPRTVGFLLKKVYCELIWAYQTTTEGYKYALTFQEGFPSPHQCKNSQILEFAESSALSLGYVVRRTFTGSLAELLVKMAAKNDDVMQDMESEF